MSERQKAPEADQGTPLIVHDQLIERTLETVDLLLNFDHDAMNLVHSFLGFGRGQVHSKVDEHDSE